MGRDGAAVNGVLVIDKPRGVGSTDVVRVVRRAVGQRKVGHTGTLDPEATGVLVVCLGRATRLVPYLQDGVKVYAADVVFGIETSSYDAAGETVREISAASIDEAAVRGVVAAFVGDIAQVPPMVSAIKVDGERLYDKARRGEHVDRAPRRVRIDAIETVAFAPGERATATLRVTCGSGTYIRSLAHDLGAVLGCGASLTALRREANGAFTLADAVALDALEAAGPEGVVGELLVSQRDAAARSIRCVEATDEVAVEVGFGRAIPLASLDGPFAVLRGPDLLAVYRNRPDEGVARAEVVFIG